ncbi:MAG: phage tail protein [Candidatus Hinthialibacter sp.]
MKTNRTLAVAALLTGLLIGAWAMEYQIAPAQVQPADFDETKPSDYPDLTNIDINVKGLTSIGPVYMLEGIENSTSVEIGTSSITPGRTSYSRLVLYGVFDKKLRDWRDDIIAGKSTTRDIEVSLRNQSGTRVLKVTFYDAMPVEYSIPPLSIDNNTRYMERYEFAYTYFEITNT